MGLGEPASQSKYVSSLHSPRRARARLAVGAKAADADVKLVRGPSEAAKPLSFYQRAKVLGIGFGSQATSQSLHLAEATSPSRWNPLAGSNVCARFTPKVNQEANCTISISARHLSTGQKNEARRNFPPLRAALHSTPHPIITRAMLPSRASTKDSLNSVSDPPKPNRPPLSSTPGKNACPPPRHHARGSKCDSQRARRRSNVLRS